MQYKIWERKQNGQERKQSGKPEYRSCAQRASILFFVLNDMNRIDPMYQFSLDAYVDLFTLSIDKSAKSNNLEERINNINDYHTYAVYRYTCRGLFERHKLLFSFHMCSKILQPAGKLNMEEFNFFLRGGVVLDRIGQIDNPCVPWLIETAWDNITELEKLSNFHGAIQSFEQYAKDWYQWYVSPEPENTPMPEKTVRELAATYNSNSVVIRYTHIPGLDVDYRRLVSEDVACDLFNALEEVIVYLQK